MTRSSEAQVLQGTLVNGLALIVGAFGTLFPVLVARLLGEAALGAYALAWATADLLSKLGIFGLDQTTVSAIAQRRAAGDGNGVHAVFRRALAGGLAASVLVAAAAAPALAWADSASGAGMRTGSVVMLLALPGVALYRISNGVSRGLGIMKHDIVSGNLARNVVALVLLLGLLGAGIADVITPALVPVVAAAGGFTMAGMVAFVLARAAVQRAGDDPAGVGSAPGLLRQSASVGAAGFLNLALTRMDVLVLATFVGRAPGLTPATFGVYCAVTEIAGFTRKIRQAMEAPILRAVASESAAESPVAAAAEAGRWMLAALLLVAGVVSFGAPVILGLFGPAVESGAVWLALLVAAQAVYSYSGLAELVLLVRRPALNVANALAAATASLGLCALLVPRLGALGAALAALAAFTLLAGLRFSQLSSFLGAPWPWARARAIGGAFLAACVPAVALRCLLPGRAGAALAAGAFLAVYLVQARRSSFGQGDRLVLAAAFKPALRS